MTTPQPSPEQLAERAAVVWEKCAAAVDDFGPQLPPDPVITALLAATLMMLSLPDGLPRMLEYWATQPPGQQSCLMAAVVIEPESLRSPLSDETGAPPFWSTP